MDMPSTESTFRVVWIAPSIILSFGVTRLCSDAILVFRSRHQAPLDWMPLAWAACIFIWQLQYLWAIIELPNFVRTWTLGEFAALIGLSLTLFVAAALVLPDKEIEPGSSLEESFVRIGHWALLALSLYGFLAVYVDVWMFSESLFSPGSMMLAVIALMPLLFLASKGRGKRGAIAVANLPFTLFVAWYQSPAAY